MEGEDLATTVLTCEGDIKDPTFPFKLQLLVNKLQNLISDGMGNLPLFLSLRTGFEFNMFTYLPNVR